MKDILKLLRERDHFIILTHISPDGDTLGSAAGLCLGLRKLGKTAYVGCNPEITPRYLPFVQELFPPQGYTYDTVITVDIASQGLIPLLWRDLTVDARIDHHPTLTDNCYAMINYIDTAAAACGEIILLLLLEMDIELCKDIAKVLYLAITTDTGCFRFSSTTARTHRLAAMLLEAGLAAYEIDEMVFSQKSPSRIEVESTVLRGIEYSAGGKIALASLYLENIAKAKACEDDLESLSALPRQILGVVIGLLIRQEQNCCKISVRTAAPYEANLICSLLGGGGHARAGGCRLHDADVKKARELLLTAVRQCYPGLWEG
ncbi:MAG: DHH family phosphoesterase [Oscillospiraceae bacterium]|nr:DHH family phosphoesterase [Oscillospiraceae bacterium]